MSNGLEASALELSARYEDRSLSPVTIAEASLRRSARVDEALSAFVTLDHEQALEAAAASEARWKEGRPLSRLDGVPITIKDTDAFAGQKRMVGSLANENVTPSHEDAPHIRNLRKAGAVVIGRTTMADSGWKGLGDSPLSGVARNPWNPDFTPGGSSAGAAISVATRCVPIATGTDGAGSIRIPAAFTGLYGIKPTNGRVPSLRHGALDDMTAQGPLTQSVEDAALALNVMCQADSRDPINSALVALDYVRAVSRGVVGLKVAVSPTLGFASIAEDRVAPIREAADVLASAGAIVEWTDPPAFDASDALACIWAAGYAASMDTFSDAQFAVLDPGLQEVILRGREISAVNEKQAQRGRTELMHIFIDFFRRYDLILAPVVAIAPPKAGIGLNTPDTKKYPSWIDWARHAWTLNLTRLPAASFPWALDAQHLPQAVQLIASHFKEDVLLRASGVLQRAKPISTPADEQWTHLLAPPDGMPDSRRN